MTFEHCTLRQLVLDLLRTERAELERLSGQDGISPAVADRAIRDLELEEASTSG